MGNPGTTPESSSNPADSTDASSNTANTTEASAGSSKITKNKKINRNARFTMKEILSQKVALYGDYLKKLHYSDPTQSGSENIDTDTAFEEDLAYFKEMRAMYQKRNEN